MKLSEIQLIQWPRGYRRKVRKAAQAEGLSVNEWLVKKVSAELETSVHREMVGKASGTPPEIIPDRTNDSLKIRSTRLARNFRRLGNWIRERRPVTREPVNQYLEHPQPIQVTIPLQSGETRRFHGTAKFQGRAKRWVTAEFREETLPPINEIDLGKQCLVTFKLNNRPKHMPASIQSIQNRKWLILKDKGFDPVLLEKRTALRIKASFSLEYKRQTQHGFCHSQSIDINTKGIQFQCQDALETGELLVLNIKLPRPEPYSFLCQARVVWSRKVSHTTHATGCQFLNLTEQERDAIADFCLREVLRREKS